MFPFNIKGNYNFDISINSIYDIEEKKFIPYKDGLLENLYFHATDKKNNNSILTDGFKIITECSNYGKIHLKKFNNKKMFGNGIYFSDILIKSAKFSNNIFACELIMNKPIALSKDYYEDVRKFNYDSIIGLGKFNKYGKLINPNLPLNYYEYVVYKNNQIKKKYILNVTLNKKKFF